MRQVSGSCHCGNIAFDFYLPEPGPAIAVRACGCTFCKKHGGVWTSHPGGRLVGRLGSPNEVNHYQFDHGTADFFVCKQCGAVPFVVSTIDGNDRAVVNALTFDNVPAEELVVSDTDFDAEDVDDRLERRLRNWIGAVEIH